MQHLTCKNVIVIVTVTNLLMDHQQRCYWSTNTKELLSNMYCIYGWWQSINHGNGTNTRKVPMISASSWSTWSRWGHAPRVCWCVHWWPCHQWVAGRNMGLPPHWMVLEHRQVAADCLAEPTDTECSWDLARLSPCQDDGKSTCVSICREFVFAQLEVELGYLDCNGIMVVEPHPFRQIFLPFLWLS